MESVFLNTAMLHLLALLGFFCCSNHFMIGVTVPMLLIGLLGEYRARGSVLEDFDKVLCRPTDPSKPLANNLGIV